MNPACESNTEPPGQLAPSVSIDSSVAASASRRSTPWQWWSTRDCSATQGSSSGTKPPRPWGLVPPAAASLGAGSSAPGRRDALAGGQRRPELARRARREDHRHDGRGQPDTGHDGEPRGRAGRVREHVAVQRVAQHDQRPRSAPRPATSAPAACAERTPACAAHRGQHVRRPAGSACRWCRTTGSCRRRGVDSRGVSTMTITARHGDDREGGPDRRAPARAALAEPARPGGVPATARRAAAPPRPWRPGSSRRR